MAYSCVVCGGLTFKKIRGSVRDSQDYSVVECEYCQHQQLDPLPSIEKDQEFYDNDLQAKPLYKNLDIQVLRKKATQDIKRRINFLRNIIDKESPILEVGTGYGLFMEQIEREGYNIQGIEISKSRRSIANSLCKSKIYNYNLLTDAISDEIKSKYHVVMLFQVLEHISEPVAFIIILKELLCNNGLLILEIPNLNDHLLNFCDKYKDFYYQRAHVSYFTPKTIDLLLRNTGFKDIKIFGIQRYSLDNLMNWLIKGGPQVSQPSYKVREELQWLDTYYRNHLSNELKTDTLMVIAKL